MIKSWNAHYLCAILGCKPQAKNYACSRCGSCPYDPEWVESMDYENLLAPYERLIYRILDWPKRFVRVRRCSGCARVIKGKAWHCDDPKCDWIPF